MKETPIKTSQKQSTDATFPKIGADKGQKLLQKHDHYLSNTFGLGSVRSLPEIPLTPDNILSLQRTLRNQAVTKLIQTKLRVGWFGDQCEQEADRVADQVMATPEPKDQQPIQHHSQEEDEIRGKSLAFAITPIVQRHETPEAEEKKGEKDEQKTTVQTQPLQKAEKDEFEVNDDLENRLKRSKGGGSPIADEVRAFVEPRMQFDLSKVRVHQDNEAAQMTVELGARAFTHGQDIYFGTGQYAPDSIEGKRLLTHELTHVVQQGGGVVPPLAPQRTAGNAAVGQRLDRSGSISSGRPLRVQRQSGAMTPAPKRSKPDTFLLSRVQLYHVSVGATKYVVTLDRQKHPWHAKYTVEALTAAAVVALVSHVYEKAPPPATILAELESLTAKKRLFWTYGSLESPPEIEQYFGVTVDTAGLEKVGASLDLRMGEAGERLRRQIGLGAFLDAAFVDVTRRWASIQAALPEERLSRSGLSRRNLFTMLTDRPLRDVLIELAKRHEATERLVKAFNADAALANGEREPRAADFGVLSDPEWAVALVALAARLKEIVGQAAIDRRERERKHQLNEYLSPKAVEIEDVATFVVKTYNPDSTVTVDFLGPVQLSGGQKIVNAKGEKLHLLSVSRSWIIYQNEADKRFYRQRVAGVQEELRFGVYALAAEKTKYVIPMTQFVLRLAGALFPVAGYVYTASNILHVTGEIARHWDELKALYANILISRKNIEQLVPGLFDAAVRAGVSAAAAMLFDPKQLGLALDEWIIAALKIARRVAAKQAAGQFATQAAVGALTQIWSAVKAVLGKLEAVFFWVNTLGRPLVVGAVGSREGGTSASSLADVATQLSAIGVAKASMHARQILALTSDDRGLLIDEVNELSRNGSELIQLLRKVTSW
jgi:hypothetical protein